MRDISYSSPTACPPTRPTGLPPWRARSCLYIASSPTRPPPRPLRRLHEKPAYSHDLHRTPAPNRAPQCPRFRKRGPRTSNEAALRAARAAATRCRPSCRTPPSATRRTSSTTAPFPPATSALVFLSACHRWPEVPFRPSPTSSTPDGAVSPDKAAAPAEDPRSGLTRWRWLRSRPYSSSAHLVSDWRGRPPN